MQCILVFYIFIGIITVVDSGMGRRFKRFYNIFTPKQCPEKGETKKGKNKDEET